MTKTFPTMLILALGGAALTLGGCGSKPAEQSPEPVAEQAGAGEPAATSTDWTVQNPTDPAVPVNLPKTVVTEGPAPSAKPAASPSAPDK